VERHHPHRPRDAADERLDATLHLVRRAIREGDGQDLVRLCTARRDEVTDAVGEDARLPGAGACHDQNRPLGGQNRLALRRIQVGQVALWRDDRHATDGIGAPARR